MERLTDGLYHWRTFHEGIGENVHSHYLESAEPAVVIDPRVPDVGMDWFRSRKEPGHSYLTNRHHYRHSDRFVREYGVVVWCHRAGLHHFSEDYPVQSFEHGDRLPGGITAVEVGVLCPEETAFYLPVDGGVLAVGDAIVRYAGELGFVPDELLGDQPHRVKRGLKAVFREILQEYSFDHLLFAHGTPWLGGGADVLRDFVED